MSTLESVMAELKSKGKESFLKTYIRHGIPADRTFGVSNADLKVIAKSIKGRQDLALELFSTGNMDAMYLAGIIVDGSKMTSDQLNSWAETTHGMSLISEHTVPWATVDHSEAWNLATRWISSDDESIACAGWSTLSGIVTITPDESLPIKDLENLLNHIVKNIDSSKNRVRAKMNGFVICVGCYVTPLNQAAKVAATKLGAVKVDVGDTACKVPLALEYIAKVESAGKAGQKRKTIRC